MSKPPKTTPHSDIGGYHRDEELNAEVAAKVGEGTADLEEAHEKSKGRPPYADEAEDLDNRTRGSEY